MRGLAVCALVATACGPGSYAEFRDQLVDASWHRAQRCGYAGRADRFACHTDDVLAVLHDSATDRAAPDALDVQAAIAAHRLGYDSVDAQRCLDAVSSAPCDPVLAARTQGQICNVVVRPRVAAGEHCASDLECEGGACLHEPSCAGTCIAYAGYGAACGDDASPSVAQRCDPTVAWCDGTCQPKRAKGKVCGADRECAVGYACVAGHCADPVTLEDGAACGGGDPCKRGRACNPVSRRCEKQLQRGLPCDSALACQDGLACVGLAAGTRGLCADWQDAGAACSATGQSGCPLTQACESGVCVAPAVVPYAGERCVTGPCAIGLGCNLLQVCDWLRPRGGNCGGTASTLCEPGLVCSQYGEDLGVSPGVCTPAMPVECAGLDEPDAGP